MVKMITLLKRKPGVSREEFSDHWFHPHGDIIMGTIPGVRKYVQNTAIIMGQRECEYDGIAEGWFDDMDSLSNALSVLRSENGVVIREDEEKFLDRSKMISIVVQEREVELK